MIDLSEATQVGHMPHHSTQECNTDLAVTADPLFNLILKFNLFPALYVHASWIKSLSYLDADTSPAQLNPYWVRYLSKTLLTMSALDKQWEFDFANPVKKLALIDAEDLLKLGHYVAAILVQTYLRKIVSGSKIAIINQVIGAENREFALRWKSAQQNSLDLTLLKALIDVAYNAMAHQQDWQRFVHRLIISLLKTTGLRSRLIFKFSIEYRDVENFQLTADKQVLVAALFFDVLRQQLPGWHKRLELTSPGDQQCNG